MNGHTSVHASGSELIVWAVATQDYSASGCKVHMQYGAICKQSVRCIPYRRRCVAPQNWNVVVYSDLCRSTHNGLHPVQVMTAAQFAVANVL